MTRADARTNFDRLAVVDGLLGLAALSVAWFHFMNGAPSSIRWTGVHGWMGVEMFFVISGCVIPISMYRSGYRPADFFVFACKRVVRLDPFVHGAGGYLFVATMAVLASIAAGWVMYHLLERPTQGLSSRMTFESDPPIPATS